MNNDSLDEVYTSILSLGLIALRNAGDAKDSQRCVIEADHLHNLPSLIGEENISRHLYYLNKERVRYVEKARAHDAQIGNSACMETVRQYAPHWEELLSILGEMASD